MKEIAGEFLLVLILVLLCTIQHLAFHLFNFWKAFTNPKFPPFLEKKVFNKLQDSFCKKDIYYLNIKGKKFTIGANREGNFQKKI